MKERPIIFGGPMVKAILEGRKTQTRRVVRPQPELATGPWGGTYFRSTDGKKHECPYGKPGDVLYVRETHGFKEHPRCRIYYKADMMSYGLDNGCAYPDEDSVGITNPCKIGIDIGKPARWRPSIHMPKWASRIKLMVTDVRVERVQDISLPDIMAEGTDAPEGKEVSLGYQYREEFEKLWNLINAKRGVGWEVNPWVWVVTFKRMK